MRGRCTILTEFTIFVQVFDGHSGSDAANYAKDNLHTFFAGYLDTDSLNTSDMHKAMVRPCQTCTGKILT